jgi:hypothetical protein
VVSAEAVVAVHHGGRHRSHFGKPGGKLPLLRVGPADCGTHRALRRPAAFEPRHRSLPLGIRRRHLAGRRPVVVAAEEVGAQAVDERIQLERATAVTSVRSTISSFCNLASSHLMYFQTRQEDTNTGRPPVLRGGSPDC